MSILDGFKRKKKYLKTPDGYKLESYWTSSESVEFSDGKTAEEKLSGINGITDSLSDDSSDICLSSAAGNNLQKQVTAINSNLNSKATKYTSKGSSTQPVYIDSNGVPTAIPYTIGKSVPGNAVFTDTNTWRGIQNNLTSTSTTDSLSAAQGRLLANGYARDNTKVPLDGGSMTGILNAAGIISSSGWLDLIYNGINKVNLYTNNAENNFTIRNNVDGYIELMASKGINCIKSGGWTQISASAFNTVSSRKYKENIVEITEEQAKQILNLNPVQYNYTNDKSKNKCFGLIAEEAYSICPYQITLKDGQPDSIDYSKYVPQLIKMIQILQKEIDDLKK